MAKLNIENLAEKRIKAKVIDSGKYYPTYDQFADAAGYPDAVDVEASKEYRTIRESRLLAAGTVDVLAKGNHGTSSKVIYVVQTKDGEQFLIGADGVELMYPKLLSEATFEELTEELQNRYDERLNTKEIEVSRLRSPQKNRGEIVERAKYDLEDLRIKTNLPSERCFYAVPASGSSSRGCYADFIVNDEKRTIVVLMRECSTKRIFARGKAKCHPDECFNSHIGKAIALRRALGLEVPTEYLDVPRPEGIEIGDVVIGFYTFKKAIITEIDSISGTYVGRYEGGDLFRNSRYLFDLIDDSGRY